MIGVFADEDAGDGGVPPARGFLLSGGVYTTFAAPGFRYTIAYGLNDRGQIVGSAANELEPVPGATAKAYLLAEGAKGRFTLFNRPGTTATLAFDINNRGQIVGVAGNIPPGADAPSEGQPSAQQDGIAMGAMGLMGMRPGRAEAR
jgi:uncharacterized membrane protein